MYRHRDEDRRLSQFVSIRQEQMLEAESLVQLCGELRTAAERVGLDAIRFEPDPP